MVVLNVLTQCNRSAWLAGIFTTVEEVFDKKALIQGTSIQEVDTLTFNKVVTKSGRNALIFFYSPECRHCKAFFPTWREVAIKLKDEDLDIVQIDAKSNTWPEFTFPVFKFPTVYWKFADDSKPEKYKGNRTTRDVIKFVASKTQLNAFDRNGNPKPKKIK